MDLSRPTCYDNVYNFLVCVLGKGIIDEDDEQLARAIQLSLSKTHEGVEGKIEFSQLQRNANGTGKL